MSKKELQGCGAFPKGAGCPVEWCERNRHDAMCLKRKCKHYTPGVRVGVSVYQQEKLKRNG